MENKNVFKPITIKEIVFFMILRSITTPRRLNAILQQAPLAFCLGSGGRGGALIGHSLRVGDHYNFNFVLRFAYIIKHDSVHAVGDIRMKRCIRGSVVSLCLFSGVTSSPKKFFI